jgi:hypothetical protein
MIAHTYFDVAILKMGIERIVAIADVLDHVIAAKVVEL